jgi:hypothetical protein
MARQAFTMLVIARLQRPPSLPCKAERVERHHANGAAVAGRFGRWWQQAEMLSMAEQSVERAHLQGWKPRRRHGAAEGVEDTTKQNLRTCTLPSNATRPRRTLGVHQHCARYRAPALRVCPIVMAVVRIPCLHARKVCHFAATASRFHLQWSLLCRGPAGSP